jgi:hypothetical protein
MTVVFNCSNTEAFIAAKNGPRAIFGNSSIYIGYQQVSGINKDPRMIRFDNGTMTWCRTDYETTGDDNTGYGLYWDGANNLFGVFSATGTQTGNDFRRFSTGRWLPSYGSGGGPRVAIIAKINATNGDVQYSTYLSARLSDGRSNSLVVTSLNYTGTAIDVGANSWFAPRRTNKLPMNCTGSSPFRYNVTFAIDMITALSASAINCV